jgi:hypothetical protein
MVCEYTLNPRSNPMLYLPLAAALAVGVFAAVALLVRARAARRWAAAVDRYADREIARSRRLAEPFRGPHFAPPHSRTVAPRAAFLRSKTHERQR